MANSEDPDETVYYRPSHLDLHCLHKNLFLVVGLIWLTLSPGTLKAICPSSNVK